MKFWIHTYGCQMNVRDSEAVEALLLAAGHEQAQSEEDAEVVIVNSCTVRQKAEEKAVGKAGNMIAAKKITGMMGCAVKRMGKDIFKRLPKLDFAVGPRRFGLIPHIIDEIVKTHAKGILEIGDDETPTGMDAHPDIQRSGTTGCFQSYVTILIGCDNRCSYCIVPDVRGHEYSRPAREIVAEIGALASRGVKEVCLLGQSVLRYGMRNPAWDERDAPSPGGYIEAFPRLLEAVASIPGIERIRFTSAHPKGCTDELIRVYKTFPQVCRHLHLPVQSGSDRVLAQMGRRYTRAEYLAAVKKLRDFDPEFALTTDVIVGYPGETEADFEQTRSLMEEAGLDDAFIFKYAARPGTRSAAVSDDVPMVEKERRNQVLLADQEVRGQRNNDRLIGTVREVMVEGPSKRNHLRCAGRDSGNRIVVWEMPGEACSMPAPGDMVRIRITAAHPQILLGEPL